MYLHLVINRCIFDTKKGASKMLSHWTNVFQKRKEKGKIFANEYGGVQNQ